MTRDSDKPCTAGGTAPGGICGKTPTRLMPRGYRCVEVHVPPQPAPDPAMGIYALRDRMQAKREAARLSEP